MAMSGGWSVIAVFHLSPSVQDKKLQLISWLWFFGRGETRIVLLANQLLNLFEVAPNRNAWWMMIYKAELKKIGI